MLFAAGFGAAAMIANQVAGKATRDAMFLTHFPVSALPVMVIMTSLLSIAAGLLTARLMTSVAPSLVVPRIFLLSSVFHFVEWWVAGWNSGAAAILIYLQIGILGSALISGFWSMLDDRFDARTARKHLGRIVAASTFGGLVGGIVTQFVGSGVSIVNMLPVLAGFHLICALIATTLSAGCKSCKRTPEPKRQQVSGLKVLATVPYVRNLALLILASTLGAGLLDYVFKVKAAAVYADGPELVRFFAFFYTASGIATFLVQSMLSRVAVEKLGIAGTVGSLPLTLAFGSIGGLVFPGLPMALTARGGEAVLRTSFFKSAYELLYTAIPRRERRATKTILDVGVERFADLLGALALGAILLVSSQNSTSIILAVAAALGLGGFWISRQLERAYVQALENTLLSQMGSAATQRTGSSGILRPLSDMTMTMTNDQEPQPVSARVAYDKTVRHIQELRSGDADVVRRRLSRPVEPELAAYVIDLLAWDAVSADAIAALGKIGPKITGQLVDALVNASTNFAARRRIPRILVEFNSQRAVDGLVEALSDGRFEVRFHAAQALAQIQHRNRSSRLSIDRVAIIQAVERDLDTSPDIWRQYRIIDAVRREQEGPIAIEHVFRLLELVHPGEALQIAYRGATSPNDHLRGTSLEYLENVLPLRVWQRIQPVFEESVLQPVLAS